MIENDVLTNMLCVFQTRLLGAESNLLPLSHVAQSQTSWLLSRFDAAHSVAS